MWLELGVSVLLLLAVLQSALLLRLWRQSMQLQQRIDLLSHETSQAACTDVPTSMLVTALGRVERQMQQIEQQMQQIEQAPPPPTHQAYELAQQLAREGADLEHLVSRCGLSRDEARLVMQMHPANS
ncbi:DUF2802 domain-containing protein [Rhodanobacter sp. AS-Z3]|uniref:DUF2802 domain-containing protein n=1 Tax=Rhodanobacter sp. AS-Z3 TaxID=3031330 RepID=UPI00247ADFBC|nr:DUF2802 domain-containing protein [Rhodanobacter sp. AS-Z3]WEN14587.1 DUF2802 domain-containing protein [Rhodanobacter sp. AS-Z3]